MTASYQRLLEQAIAERDPDHPVWTYNPKPAGRALAASLGVNVPELLDGPGSLADLTPPARPFVLKPSHGCTSHGVYPLVPTGDGYRNLFGGPDRTWQQILDAAHAETGAKPGHPDRVRGPWFIEECLTVQGRLAYDWKGYVFGGEPAIIWQTDHNGAGGTLRAGKWWLPDWTTPDGDVAPHPRKPYDPTLPPPVHGDALLDTFATIGRHIDGPFVRVDLYETDAGVWFGEITPHPFGGTVKFTAEWDARLGEAWTSATSSTS